MQSVPKSDIISTEVLQPETRGNGSSSYIVYTVTTHRRDSNEDSSVERRFNDFAWLRESLLRSNKGIIVPPLPQKNMSMELSLDSWGIKSKTRRSSVEFIKNRQRGLAFFLKQVVSHVKLKSDPTTQAFLCANKADIELARVNSPNKQDTESSFYSRLCRITGTISKSLGIGKSVERTVEDITLKNISDSNRKSTVCLAQLLDSFTDIEKRQLQISESWFNTGVASQGLSKFISDNPNLNHDYSGELTNMLGGLARSAEQVSNLMTKMVNEMSLKCSEPLLELKRTGPVIDSILKNRETTLREANECKSRFQKVKTQRGIGDPETVAQVKERASKADANLKEITSTVVSEYDSFRERKFNSLKNILRDFVNMEVQFYEQSITEFKKLEADLVCDTFL